MRTLVTTGGGPKVWAAAAVTTSAATRITHTDLGAGRGTESLQRRLEGNISLAMDGREGRRKWLVISGQVVSDAAPLLATNH
jgi:hypothetical protein